jgi:hypothetical protein
MKLWRPSYCACIVEEIYAGTEIVGGGQVIRKCVPHQAVPDAALWDMLLNKESRPAMTAYRALLADDAIAESTLDQGQVVRKPKAGTDIRFSYEGTGENRDLVVTLEGGTGQARTRATAILNGLTLGKRVRLN